MSAPRLGRAFPGASRRAMAAAGALLPTILAVAPRTDAQAPQRSFWTVEPAPSLKIGSTDGADEYTFTYINYVFRTPDGRFVAIDDGRSVFRVFDAAGRHVVSHGRLGQGPGEFGREHLQGTVIAADTVGVWEGNRGRRQLFSIARGFARQHLLPPAEVRRRAWPGARDDINPRLMGRGGFLLVGTDDPGREPPLGVVTRDTTTLQWASLDLREVKTLGAYPGHEQLTLPTTRSRLMSAPPFPAALVHGWDPGGRRVCIGDTMNASLACFERGVRVATITWPHEPETIPDSAVDAWRNRLLGRTGELDALTGAGRRMVGSVELKRAKPAFAAVLLDADLNAWVDVPSRRASGQPGRTYAVFDRTGRYLGDVAMPRLTVKQIHGDVVLGVATDADGVQSIVVHRIVKGTSR